MIARRAALALPALFAMPALAQSWPARPLRMIVPWTPGQATDLIGRLFAEGISARLNVPVVVENRPGAAGAIGVDAVAKAAPDGYTLLAASSGPISINPLLQRVPYDVERELASVAIGGMVPYVLSTNVSFPAQTMAEFVARLKASPGRYTFASSGTGATAHLVAEFFNATAGVQALHVPFAGSAPAMTAILGGNVDYALETTAATMPQVRAGRLRAYGVSLRNGTALAEGVPPIARELNAPQFDVGAWVGLMMPRGTPAPIVERIAAAALDFQAQPDTRGKFTAIGAEMSPMGAAAMETLLREQKAIYEGIIRRADIRLG
jgi:tripartite-type tricarboxylate transporter receptor subunit TctC